MPDPVFIPFYHRLPPTACGELAFWVNEQVSSASSIKGAMLRRADGGLVRFVDQVRCTTCQRLIAHPVPLPEGRPEVDV